jgi:hypothetical protein
MLKYQTYMLCSFVIVSQPRHNNISWNSINLVISYTMRPEKCLLFTRCSSQKHGKSQVGRNIFSSHCLGCWWLHCPKTQALSNHNKTLMSNEMDDPGSAMDPAVCAETHGPRSLFRILQLSSNRGTTDLIGLMSTHDLLIKTLDQRYFQIASWWRVEVKVNVF